MLLTLSEARSFYDSFGKKQDAQGFYEDAALDDLLDHASFSGSENVFEFGCGTGRLADRLLAEHLSSSAHYIACDFSKTMTDLSVKRLTKNAHRIRVFQSDGSMHFDLPDNSVDRVLSTYVLDLLSEDDIRTFLLEANRVLSDDGKLCLVGLTSGVTFLSRVVSSLWRQIFIIRASLVGGCRPICVQQIIDPDDWKLEYKNVVVACGVPSEVLVFIPAV